MATEPDDNAFPLAAVMPDLPDARGLTAREHAALTLRVARSGTAWLDEMITLAIEREALEKLMILAVRDIVPRVIAELDEEKASEFIAGLAERLARTLRK